MSQIAWMTSHFRVGAACGRHGCCFQCFSLGVSFFEVGRTPVSPQTCKSCPARPSEMCWIKATSPVPFLMNFSWMIQGVFLSLNLIMRRVSRDVKSPLESSQHNTRPRSERVGPPAGTRSAQPMSSLVDNIASLTLAGFNTSLPVATAERSLTLLGSCITGGSGSLLERSWRAFASS